MSFIYWRVSFAWENQKSSLNEKLSGRLGAGAPESLSLFEINRKEFYFRSYDVMKW